jgi:hypothetical protein
LAAGAGSLPNVPLAQQYYHAADPGFDLADASMPSFRELHLAYNDVSDHRVPHHWISVSSVG